MEESGTKLFRIRREARITDGRKAGRERSMFGWI